MTRARLASIATGMPPSVMDQQDLWDGHFAAAYGNDQRAARIWRSAGVQTRRGVVDPRSEDVSSWSTETRMRRFITEAIPLGKEAVSEALASAGVSASDVGLFAVASCTGYATPGLDILLARDLGMSDAVQRLAIGHMGCYAAMPAVGIAADFVVARSQPAVVLCCELTSLHVQRPAASPNWRLPNDEIDQLVAHALFADAAAATVLVPDDPGLELVDIEARTDTSTSDFMSWDITDLGFRMGLSPRVPEVLARHLRPMVESLLSRHDLDVPEVAGWAVHPGGPRILDVAADRLGLSDSSIAPSSDILREFGNCSSATILLVLRRALSSQRVAEGDHVVMLAFGPGLTLYAALLRAVRRS